MTAVTEYMLCFPQLFQDGNGMPFPGPKQEERFGAILLCVLEKHSFLNLATNLMTCIGVHSIRKGAGT